MADVTLFLIRHPRPLIEPGICYGQLDVPAENPAATAKGLRAGLWPALPPAVSLWSSPLRRCRELAENLAESLAEKRVDTAPGWPASLRIDARLMEMNFGAWEGRPWDSIPRGELDAWAADIDGYAPPGGESPAMLRRRALAFVADLPAGTHLVVTHAGIIRVLQAHAAGDDLATRLPPAAAYGSVTRLVFSVMPAASP